MRITEDTFKRFRRNEINFVKCLKELLHIAWYDNNKTLNTNDEKNFEISFRNKNEFDYALDRMVSNLERIGAKRIKGNRALGRITFLMPDATKEKIINMFTAKEDEREKAYKDSIESADISKYYPSEEVLNKIRGYRDRGSKINVRAMNNIDKILTYYYACILLDWEKAAVELSDKAMEIAIHKEDVKNILNAIYEKTEAQETDERDALAKKENLPKSDLIQFSDKIRRQKGTWLPKSILKFFIDNNIPVRLDGRSYGGDYDRNGVQWSERENFTVYPDTDHEIKDSIVVNTLESGGPTKYTYGRAGIRVGVQKVLDALADRYLREGFNESVKSGNLIDTEYSHTKDMTKDKEYFKNKYEKKGYKNVRVKKVKSDTKGLPMYEIYGDKEVNESIRMNESEEYYNPEFVVVAEYYKDTSDGEMENDEVINIVEYPVRLSDLPKKFGKSIKDGRVTDEVSPYLAKAEIDKDISNWEIGRCISSVVYDEMKNDYMRYEKETRGTDKHPDYWHSYVYVLRPDAFDSGIKVLQRKLGKMLLPPVGYSSRNEALEESLNESRRDYGNSGYSPAWQSVLDELSDRHCVFGSDRDFTIQCDTPEDAEECAGIIWSWCKSHNWKDGFDNAFDFYGDNCAFEVVPEALASYEYFGESLNNESYSHEERYRGCKILGDFNGEGPYTVVCLRKEYECPTREEAMKKIDELLDGNKKDESLNENCNSYSYKGKTIINAGDYWFVKGYEEKFPTSDEAEEFVDDMKKDEGLEDKFRGPKPLRSFDDVLKAEKNREKLYYYEDGVGNDDNPVPVVIAGRPNKFQIPLARLGVDEPYTFTIIDFRNLSRDKAGNLDKLANESMKINIRESLNKMDAESDNTYDLLNLYESKNLSKSQKKDIARMIYENYGLEKIYKYLYEATEEEDELPVEDRVKELTNNFKNTNGSYVFEEVQDANKAVTILKSRGYEASQKRTQDNKYRVTAEKK